MFWSYGWALGPLPGHPLLWHSGLMLPSVECCKNGYLSEFSQSFCDFYHSCSHNLAQKMVAGYRASSQGHWNISLNFFSSSCGKLQKKKKIDINALHPHTFNPCNVILCSSHQEGVGLLSLGLAVWPALAKRTLENIMQRGWKAFVPLASLSPPWKEAEPASFWMSAAPAISGFSAKVQKCRWGCCRWSNPSWASKDQKNHPANQQINEK